MNTYNTDDASQEEKELKRIFIDKIKDRWADWIFEVIPNKQEERIFYFRLKKGLYKLDFLNELCKHIHPMVDFDSIIDLNIYNFDESAEQSYNLPINWEY